MENFLESNYKVYSPINNMLHVFSLRTSKSVRNKLHEIQRESHYHKLAVLTSACCALAF